MTLQLLSKESLEMVHNTRVVLSVDYLSWHQPQFIHNTLGKGKMGNLFLTYGTEIATNKGIPIITL